MSLNINDIKPAVVKSKNVATEAYVDSTTTTASSEMNNALALLASK